MVDVVIAEVVLLKSNTGHCNYDYQALDLNHRHLAGGSIQGSLEERELDSAFVVVGLVIGYSVTEHVQSGVSLSDG